MTGVSYTREDAVGLVTLDRPPANSYDLDFVRALADAVRTVADDAQAKVAIVRSASGRFFSAGADVKAFHDSPHERNMEMIRLSHEALSSLAEVPKLFVAQIGGHALGGGLEIALACDLRFGADDDYRLGTPEATLGLLPGNGGTQRLPRLIGWSRALELMATGRPVAPAEAHALGILDRLVPPGELEEETRAFAESIAAGATRAIGNIKLAVRRGIDRPLQEGLALERELVEELFRSHDGQAGIAAFLEKRQPQFQGS